jgi:hypothetical protein
VDELLDAVGDRHLNPQPDQDDSHRLLEDDASRLSIGPVAASTFIIMRSRPSPRHRARLVGATRLAALRPRCVQPKA